MSQFTVNLSPKEAATIIENYVLESGASNECVGNYTNVSSNGSEVIMLVFEKYFMRNSSRASLSVIIENVSGKTVVYSIGSGGGQGVIFKFDWGAAESFSSLIDNALESYKI